MTDPLTSMTEAIGAAIASHIRELGGDDDNVEEIATAAGYAALCWSVTASQRH